MSRMMFVASVFTLALLGALTAGCAVGYSSQIDSIMAGDTLNQASAESAPQQTVVNGWTARDLLELSARQNAETTFVLYGLLILAVALVVLLVIVAARLRRLETAIYRSTDMSQSPHWPQSPQP